MPMVSRRVVRSYEARYSMGANTEIEMRQLMTGSAKEMLTLS